MNDRVRALIEWDGELEELHGDGLLTLKSFIEKFVEPNTIIRLWKKVEGGHEQLNNGKPLMEWKLILSKYSNRKVSGITDIVVPDDHPEAINVILKEN